MTTGELSRPPDLLVVSGIEGAPLRYRGHALAQAHRTLGGKATVLHHRHRDIPNSITVGGLVVFYRVPWSSWVQTCVEAARSRQATIAFSVDDLIFSPGLRERIPAIRALPPAEAEQWMEGVRRYQATAVACGSVIASTPAIVRAAEEQGIPAVLVGNVLSREFALLSQAARWHSRDERAQRRDRGICRVGYLSGTPTHDADWRVAEPAILELLASQRRLELWLLGPVKASASLDGHPRVHRRGFRPYHELPRLQAELDVMLAPLEPGLEFSDAKSAIKWMEAAAVALPTVASPTEPFRAAISDGVDGFLADADSWLEKLTPLVQDEDVRDAVGRAARREVYRNHGPADGAREWATAWPLLRGLSAGREAGDLPGGTPLERPSVPALEPEAPAGYLDVPPLTVLMPGPRLGSDMQLTAKFTPTYPGLCRIDVETTTFGAATPATLQLRLRDGAETVAEGSLRPGELADEGWTAWNFRPVNCAGDELELTLSQPAARPGTGLAAWSDELGRINLRAWSRPDRLLVAAIAVGRPVGEGTVQQPARWLVLWHKGRHSLSSQGLLPTYERVRTYAGRWWRGLARRP